MNRDFSYLTVAATAASIVLLGVIIVGEHKQERARDNGASKPRLGVGVDGTERDGNGSAPCAEPNATEVSAASCACACGDDAGVPVSRLQGATPALGGSGTVRVGAAERRILDAIAQVESGGRDDAIGDDGKAHGRYQIWRAFWIDGGGKAAEYPAAAHNREKAEAVVLRFWQKYGARTDEARARTLNGGPAGMRKAATVGYWNRVKGAMR